MSDHYEIVHPPKWRKPREGEALPINTHQQIGDGHVAVVYHSSPVMSWQVYRKGFKTDPKGSWYNNGHKTFLLPFISGIATHQQQKKAGLERALAWASAAYNVTRWQKNTAGDYVNADANYLPLRKRERLRRKQ